MSWGAPFFVFMNLLNELLKQRLVTGPLKHSVNNSTLAVIKDWLLGLKPKTWDPRFRIYGRVFHTTSLEPKKKSESGKLTRIELHQIGLMANNLSRHVLFAMLMKDSRKEILCRGKVETVAVHGTLDIWKKKTLQAGDPKTTATTSEKAFIESVYKYGYFRQGILYCLITGAKEFYFFGVRKSYPYTIWVVALHATKHKAVFDYYYNELLFLLYIYKHYGTPVDERGKSLAADKSSARKSKSGIKKRKTNRAKK